MSVRCTGGVVWRGVQAALPALAAAVFVLWLMQVPARTGGGNLADGTMLLAALGAAFIVAAIAWRLSHQEQVLLTWSGQQWTVDNTPATPAVMVDLGNWLLLRLRVAPPAPPAPSRSRWLAVSRADAGPALHGLRTALFALTPPDAEASHV